MALGSRACGTVRQLPRCLVSSRCGLPEAEDLPDQRYTLLKQQRPSAFAEQEKTQLLGGD
jgi:hypothetical protein